MWYKITVKGFNQNPDGGREKGVSEQYLFDAVNFTEAETRATKELTPYYSSFEVKKIDPVKMSELFLNENGDKYFKCKVNYITLNEKTGKEKKTPSYIYVQASDTKSAEEVLREGMKGTVLDWVCESIAETKILDVFRVDLSTKEEGDEKEEESENKEPVEHEPKE